MMTNFSISNLTILQNKKELIKDINLTFNSGDKVAIIGNNGVGKTTLLKTLSGVSWAPKNSVILDGTDIHQMSIISRAINISLLFQTSPSQPYCLARDRIAHGLMPTLGINHILSPTEHQLVNEIAHQLNITHLLDRRLSNMSGGEQRLVNIAKCLISPKTKVILLDEPSVFLDMTQKQNVTRLLKLHAERGQIILFSSHDGDFIHNFATQTITIDQKTARFF